MKKLKKMNRLLILLVLSFLFLLPAHAAAQPDFIRLHIIANSDSLIDQSVKLGVRDSIREYTARLLENCESSDDAFSALIAHQDELLTLAQDSAAQYGFEGDVSLRLGVFPFPDRTYAGVLVPAGDYRALQITLGEGEGRNWWCVVYPSLCLPEDADTDKPIEFYSSICRWALRLWEVIAR